METMESGGILKQAVVTLHGSAISFLLGAVAEIKAGGRSATNVFVRMALNAEESEVFAPTVSRMMEGGPLEYMAGEMHKARLESKPGERIDWLVARHRHAFRVENPEVEVVPEGISLTSLRQVVEFFSLRLEDFCPGLSGDAQFGEEVTMSWLQGTGE